MKHFVVEIDYKVSIEKIEETRQEHRNFVKAGFEREIILIAGAQVLRIGGIIIARGESMEEIAEFFKNDPYQIKKLAEYHYIEFKPLYYQEFLKDWLDN